MKAFINQLFAKTPPLSDPAYLS